MRGMARSVRTWNLLLLAVQALAFVPHRSHLFVARRPSSRAFSSASSDIDFNVLRNKHVLVVGGSGRVGGSVVTQLLKHGAKVTVGGTRSSSYEDSKTRWLELFPSLDLTRLAFSTVDREKAESVMSVLNADTFDLVVHTAGPFQGKVATPNGVIAAAVSNGVPYVDVCDDYCTARATKTKYEKTARDSQVPCIISTGCWPGVSSLMAKQLSRKVLESDKSLKAEDLTIDFSFFTAGSGGAGSTLLVATFLILAEEALTIVNGRRKPVKAMKEYSVVNFGPIVGDKPLAHLNLLETASVHDILGVGNVKALFGTAPSFWNTLLGWMAQLPPSLLSNQDIMTKLAVFSLPIVRLVDYFAGATNAMRVDVTTSANPLASATAIYAHENLEPCVGECVVAFCCAVLAKKVEPGVWFPEEAIANREDVAAVLSLASIGAHTTEVDSTVGLTKEEVWGNVVYTEGLVSIN